MRYEVGRWVLGHLVDREMVALPIMKTTLLRYESWVEGEVRPVSVHDLVYAHPADPDAA